MPRFTSSKRPLFSLHPIYPYGLTLPPSLPLLSSLKKGKSEVKPPSLPTLLYHPSYHMLTTEVLLSLSFLPLNLNPILAGTYIPSESSTLNQYTCLLVRTSTSTDPSPSLLLYTLRYTCKNGNSYRFRLPEGENWASLGIDRLHGIKVLHPAPWLDLTYKIVGKRRSCHGILHVSLSPRPVFPSIPIHESANVILLLPYYSHSRGSLHFLGSPHVWSDRSSLIYALVDKNFSMTFLLTTEYGLKVLKYKWFGENWGKGARKDDGWGSHLVLKKADSKHVNSADVFFISLRA